MLAQIRDQGVALINQGHFADADVALLRATELDPNHGGVKYNHSFLLLLLGNLESGFALYENRWHAPDLAGVKRNFSQPQWQGEQLHGRRILIHHEQGFGDSLQFIRYVPLVVKCGGLVILECPSELEVLFSRIEGVSEIVRKGSPLPEFELHSPMMSLPLALRTGMETIPASIPYLHADPSKVSRWCERLKLEEGRLMNFERSRIVRVGIVWAGGDRRGQPNAIWADRRRSLHLDQFAPLASVPGIIFVSLQKGSPAAQAQTPPDRMTLRDWTDELHDFDDAAALVECLDLVISVDTAVAHLAGALGRPVWLLNRFDTCWRWFLGREDTPWYPTMRIFRQPAFGDWPSVMDRVAEELVNFVATAT